MSETRYARIINEETKEVQVGVGCPDEYYVEIGMTEMEVEQAYNSLWYVAGFAPVQPEPTEEEKTQARIAELKALLDSKDYWTSKRADGEYTEEEWAEKVAIRKAWRTEINELEKLLTNPEDSAIV